MRAGYIVVAAALLVAGCSKKAGPTVAKDLAVAEAPAPSATNQPAAIAAPQIAYTYGFSFQLPGDRISPVQAQHVALCDRLGPARCHVVSMDQSRGEHGVASAKLTLAVAAGAARGFGDALVAAVGKADGETVARTISGEDLSKQIVDVQARLRGRQALADRLLGVVQTHKGGVADLVAAEKALADVQQEIDTARSELAEAQGRVAMSTLEVDYSSAAGVGGFLAPIRASLADLGSVAGGSVATLLTLLAGLLPWIPVIFGIALLARWFGRRTRAVRRANHPPEPDETELPS